MEELEKKSLGIKSFLKAVVEKEGKQYDEDKTNLLIESYSNNYDSIVGDIGRKVGIPEDGIQEFKKLAFEKYKIQPISTPEIPVQNKSQAEVEALKQKYGAPSVFRSKHIDKRIEERDLPNEQQPDIDYGPFDKELVEKNPQAKRNFERWQKEQSKNAIPSINRGMPIEDAKRVAEANKQETPSKFNGLVSTPEQEFKYEQEKPADEQSFTQPYLSFDKGKHPYDLPTKSLPKSQFDIDYVNTRNDILKGQTQEEQAETISENVPIQTTIKKDDVSFAKSMLAEIDSLITNVKTPESSEPDQYQKKYGMYGGGVDLGNKDRNVASTTKATLEKAKDYYEAVANGDSNAASKFWGGLKTIDLENTLSLGIKGMVNSIDIYQAAKNYSNGTATPEEENLLIAKSMLDEIQSIAQKDRATAVGSGLGEMAPWLAQFAVTGGLGTGVAKATTSIIGKSLAAKVTGRLIGSAAQTAAQIPMMGQGTAERMSDRYAVGQGGELVQSDQGEGFGEALLRTYANNYLENVSERLVGDAVDKLAFKGVKSFLNSKTFGKTKVADVINWSNKNPYFKLTNRTLGLNTPLSENIEEAFTGLTQPFVTEDNWKDIKKGVGEYYTGENLYRTFLTTAAMGAGMGGVQFPMQVYNVSQSEQGRKLVEDGFDDKAHGLFYGAATAETIEEREKYFTDLVKLTGLTKKEMNPVMHYYQTVLSQIENGIDPRRQQEIIQPETNTKTVIDPEVHNEIKVKTERQIQIDQKIKEVQDDEGNVTTVDVDGQKWYVKNSQDLGKPGWVIFIKDANGNTKPVKADKITTWNKQTPEEVKTDITNEDAFLESEKLKQQEVTQKAAEKGIEVGAEVENEFGTGTVTDISKDGVITAQDEAGQISTSTIDETAPVEEIQEPEPGEVNIDELSSEDAFLELSKTDPQTAAQILQDDINEARKTAAELRKIPGKRSEKLKRYKDASFIEAEADILENKYLKNEESTEQTGKVKQTGGNKTEKGKTNTKETQKQVKGEVLVDQVGAVGNEVINAVNNTLPDAKADIEKRRPTSYIKDSKDKKSSLETFRNEAKREWDGVSVITGDRMKNLYVGIQLFVEAYPEHKELLDKFIKKENGTIGITNNNLSFVLNTLKKQGITTENELGGKINAKYDAELANLVNNSKNNPEKLTESVNNLGQEVENVPKTGQKPIVSQSGTISQTGKSSQKVEPGVEGSEQKLLTSREKFEEQLSQERKQRILTEGTGFDKEFGLIPVNEIKSGDDILENVNKIVATLKENEGNKNYDSFEGFAYGGKYAKNAGEQIREYLISIDVLPLEIRKSFADKIGVSTADDVVKWGENKYKSNEANTPIEPVEQAKDELTPEEIKKREKAKKARDKGYTPEETKERKAIRDKALSFEPINLEQAVLQYLIAGNRLNWDEIKRELFPRSNTELRKRIALLSNKSESIDNLRGILNGLPFEEQANEVNVFRNAVLEVILRHDNRQSMAERIIEIGSGNQAENANDKEIAFWEAKAQERELQEQAEEDALWESIINRNISSDELNSLFLQDYEQQETDNETGVQGTSNGTGNENRAIQTGNNQKDAVPGGRNPNQERINKAQKELKELKSSLKTKQKEIDSRNGLFGDVASNPNDLFGQQGFDAKAAQQSLGKNKAEISRKEKEISDLIKAGETAAKENQAQQELVIPESKQNQEAPKPVEDKQYDWDIEFSEGNNKGQRLSELPLESIDMYDDNISSANFENGGIFQGMLVKNLTGALSIAKKPVKIAIILDGKMSDNAGKLARIQRIANNSGTVVVENPSKTRDDLQFPFMFVPKSQAADYTIPEIFKTPIQDRKFYLKQEIAQLLINDGTFEKQIREGRDVAEVIKHIEDAGLVVPKSISDQFPEAWKTKLDNDHRQAIKQAISDKKEIPENVKIDYPELFEGEKKDAESKLSEYESNSDNYDKTKPLSVTQLTKGENYLTQHGSIMTFERLSNKKESRDNVFFVDPKGVISVSEKFYPIKSTVKESLPVEKPVSEDKKQQPGEKIEDFGEKIEGAKKMTYQRLQQVTTNDIINEPLSKTFPRPDFVQLVKDGTLSENAAILLKYVYESIPAKPRKKYRVSGWANTVQGAIDLYSQLLQDKTTATELENKVANSAFLKEKYGLFKEVQKALGFPAEDINTGAYEIKKFHRGELNDKEGITYSIVKSPYILGDFKTVQEAAEGLKKLLAGNKAKSKDVKLSVYQDRKTSKFFIGKKTATGVFRVVDNIETVAEARDMIKTQQAQLQELWDNASVKVDERRKTNRARVGADYRKGKDITPNQFTETFGFRGTQFGNWVKNDERQDSLNDAYDALMDLSTALKVSPRALSLGGELGMAFGARGSGKYSAHYEAGQVVINLTKTRGAGSLAHEWWHALDNYFSRQKGSKDGFLTESPGQGIKIVDRKVVPDEKLRNELIDAFKGVINAIKKSNLGNRSFTLDGTRSQLYWSTMIEMSARSFENFIIEKLGATNEQNDYLANFKETGEWINSGVDINSYPYPLKDESPAINEAFQQFFDTIQEKTDEEGNSVLFRMEDEAADTFYSPTEKALESIKQEKGTAEQFKAMLLKNGAKQAELDWMGFDEFSQDKKSLTKADIQNWIDQNKIEVEEVQKSYGAESIKRNVDEYWIYEGTPDKLYGKKEDALDHAREDALNDYEGDEFGSQYDEDGDYIVEVGDKVASMYDYKVRKATLIDLDNVNLEEYNDTKFSQYVLPGGENYKELLLTMPSREQSWKNIDDFKQSMRDKYGDGWKSKMSNYENDSFESMVNGESKRPAETFRSSHYDEPNILAHIRFNERIGENGERVLFIEEIQSDWAQKGRKEGFRPKKSIDSIRDYYIKRYLSVEKSYSQLSDEDRTWLDNLIKDKGEFIPIQESNLVPDMPFKQTPQWVNLALRRMIRYAAENGFDKVAWTTGEMQAERYDLSKQVDEVETIKHGNEYSVFVYKDNHKSGLGEFTADKLADVVGKELAEKIVNSYPENTGGTKNFKGLDLKVGGEGMKTFYDAIIPNAANSLGKKFGAKVEATEINTGNDINNETGEYVPDNMASVLSLHITQKMKEVALTEGFPLFQIIGESGAANLDKAEEATTRLDNLGVAREMEKGKVPNENIVDYSKLKVNEKYYLRLSTKPDIDIERKTSVHLTPYSSIKEAEQYDDTEEYVNLDNGNGIGQILAGLAGYELESENIEDAIDEASGKLNKDANSTIFSDRIPVIYKGIYKDEIPDGFLFNPKSIAAYIGYDEILKSAKEYKEEIPKNIVALYKKQFTPQQIKLATGWERGGKDNKWRYEVPDIELKFTFDEAVKNILNETLTLSDVVNDPELFKAYPELKNTKIQFYERKAFGSTGGTANSAENTIGIVLETRERKIPELGGGRRYIAIYANDGSSLKSVLSHEIQHLIQGLEGFARGGNRETVLDSIIEDRIRQLQEVLGVENLTKEQKEDVEKKVYRQYPERYRAYQQISGEVEARNVQRRIDLTPEQRRESLLSETQDVATKDQIFLYDSLGASLESEPEVKPDAKLTISDTAQASIKEKKNTINALNTLVGQFGVPITIIHSSEVSETIGLSAKRKRGTPVAFYHNGTAYIISDKIQSVSDTKQSYLHEAILHKGLDLLFNAGPITVLGKKYNTKNELLDEVYSRLSPELISEISNKYTGGETSTKKQQREIAEEVLAKLNELEKTPSRLQVFMDSLWKFIKKLVGFSSKQFTMTDLHKMLADHRNQVKKLARGGISESSDPKLNSAIDFFNNPNFRFRSSNPEVNKVIDEFNARKNETPLSKPKGTGKNKSNETEKTIVTERTYKGEFSEAIRKKLEEIGLTRKVQTQKEAEQIGLDIIEEVGIDKALEAVRSGEVKGAPAGAIFHEKLKSIDSKMNAETDPAKYDRLAKEYADITEEMGSIATLYGQYNAFFNYIYQTSDLGFNAEKMINDYKEVNNGEISPELEAKFKQLEKDFREVQNKLAQEEQKVKELEEQASIDAIKASIQRQNKKKAKASDKIRETTDKLIELIDAGKLNRPGIFMAASPASLAWDLAMDTVKTAVKATGRTIEAIAKGFEAIKSTDWYKNLDANKKKQAKNAYYDYFTKADDKKDKDEKETPTYTLTKNGLKIPHSVIRDLVEQGIDNIEDLTQAVYDVIVDDLPDITEREVRDAITGYGNIMNQNQEEIEREIRKMKDLGRAISGLEDISEGKRPQKSGLQRDKPDPDQRAIHKQVREAMKLLPVDEERKLNQQKTQLDAAKQRLINQIEDLQREIDRGELTPKNARTMQEDEELIQLRKDRDAKKAEHEALFNDEDFLNKKRVELSKKAVNRRIKELEKRIADGDFAPKVRKELIADNELIKLRAEKLRIQEEYKKEMYKAKLRNRTQSEKIKDGLWDAWNITRALRATGEFSFVGIQGLINTIAHPIQAKQAFRNAIRFFSSQRKADDWINNLKSQEWYPMLKESKLAITEPNAEITAREELFYSGWTDMIWNSMGKMIGKNTDTWINSNPMRAIERAAVGYLDTQRVLRFLDGVEMLKEKGLEFNKENKQAYVEMADVINTFTGRASIGRLDPELLTKIFFSPRNWSSVIKSATPYAFYHFGKKRAGAKAWRPSVAQKMALADYSKFVGLTASIVSLIALALNGDDDDENKVELDPRSTDFGKIKIGNIHIDPWGGRIQQVVLISRLINGNVKNSYGEVIPVGTPYKSPTKAELILQIATNKLAPSASMIYKHLSAKVDKDGNKVDQWGEPYSLPSAIKENLYPIYWETLFELAEDDITALDGLLAVYSFFGGGVNIYDNTPEKITDRKLREQTIIKSQFKEDLEAGYELTKEDSVKYNKSLLASRLKQQYVILNTRATRAEKEGNTKAAESLRQLVEDSKVKMSQTDFSYEVMSPEVSRLSRVITPE